ncbi:MAG: hypothetical protein RJA61_142 [Candidatus Parcubacteria bacterium]|jgi:molecular chaperone GrpE
MSKKEHDNDLESVEEELSDVVPEEDSDHARGGETKSEVVRLKEKLKEVEAKKQEYLDSWQRAQAEFINIRKRDEERNKEIVKFANEDVLLQIIPVLDSFDMAFGNKESWEKVSKDWRIGVEYIYSQLLGVLQNNGVVQLNPENELFNIEFHEAIEEVPVEKEKEGKIITVIQKGYKLNDRIIRTAKVKVGAHS